MTIWAIADLHLSFGVPNKKMDIFGTHWKEWTKRIENHWRKLVAPEDLVLIPGDISWAMRLEEVRPDLDWIGNLPGTKMMIRGNHDYWWNSLSQINKILPSSCHLIQNNSLMWHDTCIGGARLWDIAELNFSPFILSNDQNKELTKNHSLDSENKKIYQRELGRLEVSLKSMPAIAKRRIVMTHYPPIGAHFEETQASRLFEKYNIDIVVFGHLHNIKPDLQLFGAHNGIAYHLTACDYLPDFCLLKL